MRYGKLLSGLALGGALVSALGAWSQENVAPVKPAASAAAYESNPAYVSAMAAALAPELSQEEKLARWKKANEIAGGQCLRCFRGIIDAEFNLRSWKDAIATSQEMEGVAVESDDKFYAEASISRAMMHGDGGAAPTLHQLGEAETYLHMALTHGRSQNITFYDGQVLATLSRMDDAKAAFQQYLKNAREGDVRAQKAAQFIQDPSLARLATVDGAPVPAAVTTVEVAASPKLAPDAPAYASDPKFQKALAEAKMSRQTKEERLDNWKHANKVAGGQCVECLHQLIQLQIGAGATKDAVKSAEQLEAISANNPHERYFAEAMRGGALLSANFGQPKPDQVLQADAAFRDVLAYSPKSREVIYQEGRALAMEGKYDEAKAMFVRYVNLVPASDKLRMRAERFSDDPHLATLQMAPPFRLVTTQGEELQLDEMNGRVVVLDFWATWCGPCKETLPEVKRIAKDYANDPMLVLISVSQDSDAGVWKDFVQKNEMTWPQYRDGNKTLGEAYGVSSIPHFFTIDTNGVLKTEQVGSGADVRRVVDDAVKKAHKAEARKTAAGS